MDEVLGITRCARCGHRLNHEVECPFCSMFPDEPLKHETPKWVIMTACFLTSPFSLYAILSSRRLSAGEKVVSFSGAVVWFYVAGFLLF